MQRRTAIISRFTRILCRDRELFELRAAMAICIVRYPDRDATAEIILSSKLASQKVGLSLCAQKNRRTIFLKPFIFVRQMSKFKKEIPC